MLRKFTTFWNYLVFTIWTFVIKKTFPLIKTTVGGINFYDLKETGVDFESVIRIELPKYDLEMSNRILTNKIKLTFFHFEGLDYYIPVYGIFLSPKWLADCETEDICQYIAYCVIGS